jgi:hypothetical protein
MATVAGGPATAPAGGGRRGAARWRLSGWRRPLVVGAPVALLAVALLHPGGNPFAPGSFAAQLRDRTGLWLGVHLVLPLATGLVAAALAVLLRGLSDRAAAVSRAALGVFVVAYAMFDAVVGLGTGVLLRLTAAAPPAERAALEAVTDAYFAARLGAPIGPLILLANVAWLVAAAAAAVALRRAGAPRVSVGLLVAAGVVFAVDHSPPFGPVGMALLVAAVATLLRAARRPAQLATTLGER